MEKNVKYLSDFFSQETLSLIEGCLRTVDFEIDNFETGFADSTPLIDMKECVDKRISRIQCRNLLKKIENLIPDRKFYEEWDCHEIDIFFTKEEVEFIIKVAEISINIHHKEDFKQHLKISIEEEIGLLITYLKSLI